MEPSPFAASRPTTIFSSTASAIRATSFLTCFPSSRWRSTRVRAAASPAAARSAVRSISSPRNPDLAYDFCDVTTTSAPTRPSARRSMPTRRSTPISRCAPTSCTTSMTLPDATSPTASVGVGSCRRRRRLTDAVKVTLDYYRYRNDAMPDWGVPVAQPRYWTSWRQSVADHRTRHPTRYVGRHGGSRLLQGAGRHRHGNGRRQIGRWRDIDQQVARRERVASIMLPRRWKAIPSTCTIPIAIRPRRFTPIRPR